MTQDETEAITALEKKLSDYRLITIKKNSPLLYAGEVPPMAFYVKKGITKIYNISPSGEEKIIGLIGPRGILPIDWVFKRSPASLYYYHTFTDCQFYRLPRDDLLKIITSNLESATTYLNYLAGLYMASNVHLHSLKQSKARDKLIYIFQYLRLHFGIELDNNLYRISLRLTHQELANLLGVTRETVTNEIAKLIKAKVLKLASNYYIFDSDRALRFLGEDNFPMLKL